MITGLIGGVVAIGGIMLTLKWRERRRAKEAKKQQEIAEYAEKQAQYNTLYTCVKCDEKNRAYQLMLYHVTNNFAGCVHCEGRIGVTYGDELQTAIRQGDIPAINKHYTVATNLNIVTNEEILAHYANQLGSPSLLTMEQVKNMEKDIQSYNRMSQREEKERLREQLHNGKENSNKWVGNIHSGTVRKTEEQEQAVQHELDRLQTFANPNGVKGKTHKVETPQDKINALVNNKTN